MGWYSACEGGKGTVLCTRAGHSFQLEPAFARRARSPQKVFQHSDEEGIHPLHQDRNAERVKMQARVQRNGNACSLEKSTSPISYHQKLLIAKTPTTKTIESGNATSSRPYLAIASACTGAQVVLNSSAQMQVVIVIEVTRTL